MFVPTEAKDHDHPYHPRIRSMPNPQEFLCANSVEAILERQGYDQTFYRFAVCFEPGQIAYSAYRASRVGSPQGGSALPAALLHDLLPAWDAFAAAIMTGLGVDQAYQRYLTERSGLTVSGGIVQIGTSFVPTSRTLPQLGPTPQTP